MKKFFERLIKRPPRQPGPSASSPILQQPGSHEQSLPPAPAFHNSQELNNYIVVILDSCRLLKARFTKHSSAA